MYTLFVDGGGQTIEKKVWPTYFSCKVFSSGVEVPSVAINRFFLKSLVPNYNKDKVHTNYLPPNTSIYDANHKETNNIAEYAALYYGLLRFRKVCGMIKVTVYQDSQLIVNQVNGVWACKKEHLYPWCKAVRVLKWHGVDLQWVRREKIVPILGH